MKIKVIVFDLDDTLLDTSRLLIPIAKTPAFFERIKQSLPLMENARQNLDQLKKSYRLALLTYGHVDSQKQKVKSLGIEKDFEKFYFADPTKAETKLQYFKTIAADFAIQPSELLSIGNRRSTDVRDAKIMGCQTCLFHYGEHFDEKILVPEDQPDFTVTQHHELIKACRL